jgi:hypothetical protein
MRHKHDGFKRGFAMEIARQGKAKQAERAPMPDWLRDALNGKAGTQIVPLNKAAGAKRNLSIGEINKLIRTEENKDNE